MRTKQWYIAMYLDWVNNFITIYAFAGYYDIDDFDASVIIEIGKREFENDNK